MTHPSNPDDLERQKSLENIKKSLGSAQVEERVAGLIQSLQFGTDGLDLFIQQALQDESEQVKQAAYWVLHGHQPYLAYRDDQHPTEFAFPTDTISSLAVGSVSLKDKILAGGSWKIIRFWDLTTGQKLRAIDGHNDWVLSVAFSPNGKILASSSADRTIKLWNPTTGELLHTLQGHSSWVNAVAITPDGKTLVSASGDRTLKLWNVTTGELIRTLEGHSGSVMSLAISPDGKIIASGSADQTIKLWYMNGSEAIATWKGHSDWVQAVAIAPNGKTFVSGSRDGEIRIWNADETPETVNSGSAEILSSMNLSESGIHPILLGIIIGVLSVLGLSRFVGLLIKGINLEKNLKLKFAKFKCSEVIKKGQTLNIHGLFVSGNQPEVVWSGNGDRLQGWNFGLDKLTTGSDDFVGALGIVLNPKRLVTGGNDWVKLWDLTTGQQLHQFEGRSRPYLKSWEIFGLSTRVIYCGTQYQFKLKGIDQYGKYFPLNHVIWTATGGTIDDDGNFNAGQDSGEFNVTATVGNQSKEVSVILRKLTTIEISPKFLEITPEQHPEFKVEGLDQNDHKIPTGPITWTASSGRMEENRFIPDPNAKGKVTVTATATQTNIQRSVDVIVRPVLRRIEIHPEHCTLEPNQSQDFEIFGFDQADESIEIDWNQISWEKNGGTIEGQKTFIAGHDEKGSFKITARIEQYTATADVTISPVLRRLSIWSEKVRLEPDESCRFQVTGFDQHQQEIIPPPEVHWEATDGGIDKHVHNECTFTAGENGGEVRVTSIAGNYNATAIVKVCKLETLSLVASGTTVEFGHLVELTLQGFDNFGDLIELGPIVWDSQDKGRIEDDRIFYAGQVEEQVTITATAKGVSKSITINVIEPPRLTNLVISPSPVHEITPDDQPCFTVEGLDQRGNPIATGPITWTATSGRMEENRFIPGPNAKGTITVTATATQTNIQRSVDVIVRPVLRRIEIDPPQCTLEPNQPQDFEIKGFDQANESIEIDWNQISWEKNGGRIEGQKTFIAGHDEKGYFKITARIEQYTATADVTISPVLRRLSIWREKARLEPDESCRFQVTGFDQHQQEIIPLPEVHWEATDGRINKQGHNECTFTAGENGGEVKVTASVRDCQDEAVLFVEKLEKLILTASLTTVEFGNSVQLRVRGLDNFNNPREPRQIHWEVQGQGTVDGPNRIFYAGHLEESVTITAREKGVSDSIKINVIEPSRLTNLVISPSPVYEITPDDQPCFTVEGLDQRGNPIATGPINWTATSGRMEENRFIPDPNAKGTITVTATATQTTIQRSLDVIVRPVLRRIEIHPPHCTIEPNQSQDFEIKGFDQANESIEIDGNQVTWMPNGGRIEGQKTFIAGYYEKGSFRVTARVEQYTATADVTIIGVLRTLTISDQQLRLEPYQSWTFQVTGFDQHQQEIIPLPEVQWDATDGSINKQGNNECTFTAGENGGEVRVTASVRDCQDEAVVFVEKLETLILTASRTTVEFGNSVQLRVRGLDNFNNPREPRQIHWEVQGQGTVDGPNRIFYAGHLEESVTITAREKGVSDSIKINVIEPPRLTTLVISPSSGYEITPDDRPCFTVEGLDQRGEEIEIGPVEWSCTGCRMQGNMFIPDPKAKGTYTVTVTETQAKRTESVEVNVVSVLKKLEIHPHHSISVEPQEEKAFTVKGFDQTEAPIELKSIKWECNQGGKINHQGIFVGNYKKREVEVKATGTCGRRTLTKSVQVTLLPVLKTLEIQPQSPIQLKPEESFPFTVKGFDQYDHEIETEKIDWDSTGGEIDENGKFTADRDAKGKFLVTATVTRKTKSLLRLKIARLGLYLMVISWLFSLSWVQYLAGEEFIAQENDPNPDQDLPINTELNLWIQRWFVKQIVRLLSWILRGVAQICLNQEIEIITDSVEVTVIPVLREFKLNPESVTLQPGQKQNFTVIGLDQQLDEIEIEIEPNVQWKSSSGGSIENGSFTAGDSPCEVEVTALLNEEICLSSKVTIEAKNYHGKLGFRPVIPCLTPGGGLLWRTATGHSNSVNAVAITPDCKRVVSASLDKTLKLWDLETGEELATFSGHSNWVEAVAITPDGKQAVSASRDNTLKLWNLPRGEEVATLTGHGNSVNAVAITPDGKQAVSASGDNTLKLWNLPRGKEVATLTGHGNSVNAVAITPDGKQAVSVSRDNTLKLWDLVTGEEVATLTGHSNWVTAVAITPDGKQVVSASKEGTLNLWDLETESSVATLTGHGSGVTAVAITPSGKQVVSASWDMTLKLWDLATGEVVASFSGESKLRSCAIAPDGVTVVAGEESGRVLLLRLEGLEKGEK